MRSIDNRENKLKENDGKGAWIAFRRRILLFGGICALVMLMLVMIAGGGNKYNAVPNDYGDVNNLMRINSAVNGRGEMLSKEVKRGKMMSKQFGHAGGASALYYNNNKLTEEEKLEMILSASVHLVDVSVRQRSFQGSDDESYGNVQGVFCTIDWASHKQNPSANAMFRELVSESNDCKSNRLVMDLKTVIDAVFEHDLGARDVNALWPTGFVFHESRCGSTLVANSLAAFAPEQSRVYTESPPPVNVLTACRSSSCDKNKQAALFRDVLYLMGRTNDLNEEHLFFKFQSMSSLYIDIVQLAFPDVPWVFVYRDPVQVMMSHFAFGAKSKKAKCLTSRYDPFEETQSLAQRETQTKAENLSPEDFCAAYLATLCESVLREARISGTGRMINYDNLPDVLMDDILPTYFLPLGTKFGEREKENIRQISEVYSKGRHGETKKWVEDSDKKEQTASQKIEQAASTYLQTSYFQLNALYNIKTANNEGI